MYKIKVALVRPNYHSHLITPPLGLGYLSSYLKNKGYDTKIIDGLNLGYSARQIVDNCRDIDIVGINCLSAYFREVIELSRLLKKNQVTVVIGGSHASALPELTLQETQADYVIVGEGELSFFELVDCIEKNKSTENIQGIISRSNKKFVKRDFIENLDSLPFPDWKEMNPRFYKKAPHGGLIKSFPVAPITSTRGCSFECTFCASPSFWNRIIRFRSPENVVDEIDFLVRNFKVREIHFEDDNLTLRRTHIEDVCKSIIKRKIKVNWGAPNGVRVDTLDTELLKLMKKSGCYFLAFGIESGNQEILNRAEKKISLEKIEKAVNLTKKIGIVTQGFFIFGLPGESEQTIKETIRFSKKIGLDKAQFLLLDILPGSQLWHDLKKKHVVNWDYASYQQATWVPDGLDREKLNLAPSYAFRSFFFRPKQIYFLLKYFKFSQIPFIFRRIMDFNILPFSNSLKKRV